MKYYITSKWGWFIYDEEINSLIGKIGGVGETLHWTLDHRYEMFTSNGPWWSFLDMHVVTPLEYFIENF